MSDTDKARLLAQFERRPTKKETTETSTDEDQYEAFKPVDKRQLRLNIRTASGSWEWGTYSYLIRIVTDGAAATRIALIYTFMAVIITGRNLHAVADAIAGEYCEFIQEFDPAQWDKPTDAKASFIASIEVIADKPPMKAAEELEAV